MLYEIRTKIERSFCEQSTKLQKKLEDSAVAHRRTLRSFKPLFKDIYSTKVCLSCLARRPWQQNTLSCRHSFCPTCVSIHGQADLNDPWSFNLDTCPLCDKPNKISLHLRPATAGLRGLILDGNSNKDIELLQDVEERLQLPISITEHFDIINGRGSGNFNCHGF